MKFTKIIKHEEKIELSGVWAKDVQKLVSKALFENHNNISYSIKWLKELEIDRTDVYENALVTEVCNQLHMKLHSSNPECDWYQAVRDIFGDVLELDGDTE